jgi:hypothetical protein
MIKFFLAFVDSLINDFILIFNANMVEIMKQSYPINLAVQESILYIMVLSHSLLTWQHDTGSGVGTRIQ